MSFFSMPRGDRYYLLALIAIAFVAFLPWSRATHAGVLLVFAWNHGRRTSHTAAHARHRTVKKSA